MKRILFVLIIALVLIVPSGVALAEPTFDTIVEANETINNDVIVFDGDLEIRDGGTVRGDVIVFNGDALVEGTITGDLVIFNGDLEARGEAWVRGDCVLLNGGVEDESARGIRCTSIEGNVLSGIVEGLPAVPPVPAIPAVPTAPVMPEMPPMPEMPEMPPMPELPESRVPFEPGARQFDPPSRSSSTFADFLGVLGSTVLLGLLAAVVAAVAPQHLRQVRTTLGRKPLVSGAVGLLTAVAVPSIAVLLTLLSAVLTLICIGLLGFPIVFLLLVALAAAVVMGWIAAGTWLGEKLFRRKGRSLAATAGLGTAVLTFGMGLLGMLPFVFGETILSTAIMAVGLGAVTLTQFGRKRYPPDGEPEQSARADADKVSAVLSTLPEDSSSVPPK